MECRSRKISAGKCKTDINAFCPKIGRKNFPPVLREKKGIKFVKSFVKQKPHLKRCGFLWVKDRTRTGDLQSHNLAL